VKLNNQLQFGKFAHLIKMTLSLSHRLWSAIGNASEFVELDLCRVTKILESYANVKTNKWMKNIKYNKLQLARFAHFIKMTFGTIEHMIEN
jgi:hypothetical protein